MMEDNIKQIEKPKAVAIIGEPKPKVLVIGVPVVCTEYIEKVLKNKHNFEFIVIDEANPPIEFEDLVKQHQTIFVRPVVLKKEMQIKLVEYEPLIDIRNNPHHRKQKKWQAPYKFHK